VRQEFRVGLESFHKPLEVKTLHFQGWLELCDVKDKVAGNQTKLRQFILGLFEIKFARSDIQKILLLDFEEESPEFSVFIVLGCGRQAIGFVVRFLELPAELVVGVGERLPCSFESRVFDEVFRLVKRVDGRDARAEESCDARDENHFAQ
jgi:hypothetical protein